MSAVSQIRASPGVNGFAMHYDDADGEDDPSLTGVQTAQTMDRTVTS